MFKWLKSLFKINKPVAYINSNGALCINRDELYKSEGYKRQVRALRNIVKCKLGYGPKATTNRSERFNSGSSPDIPAK